MSIQDSDFKWFMENYEELFNTYGIGYLVIKNKKVLAKYDNIGEAVRKTKQTEKLGTFIVQYCDGTKEAYSNYIYTIGAIAV